MIAKNDKIFLAGHNGMVGSAILKKLKLRGYKKIITVSKSKLNLLDQKKVEIFLKKKKPKIVIIAAARVGGILANNNNKANFLYENLMIQTNLIHASFLAGVKNLIFLGSSCIYPKNVKQPMKKKTKESFINIGSGIEKSITGYAKFIMKKLKVKLKINYDISKPNGMKRKILDLSISRKYGWVSKTSLDKSFDLVYQDFVKYL